MKNYNFKIITEQSGLLKKKTFTLQLEDDIDTYDMFEEVNSYLQENAYTYFKLHDDEYIYFSVKRGKIEVKYEMEFRYCHSCGHRCGGFVEIWGGYDE